MSHRIAYCADGTWDNPDKETNVARMHRALALTPGVQYTLYDDGIGADGLPLEKLIGGAFGTGVFKKIKDAYYRLALSYESGSAIYLFGFSRGAYTVRALAGMLTAVGLPLNPFNQKMVDTAFNAYRQKNKRERAKLLESIKRYDMESVNIEMIGVWDTVGSLGIPAMFGKNEPILYGFLDTSLHPSIRRAYQALAIDERRMEFPPTLWTSPAADDQILEQVWFSGVHSSVGGGSGCGLADITLAWMMQKAEDAGLTFEKSGWDRYARAEAKHALDSFTDSWNVGWGYPKSRNVASDAAIANSVGIRCASLPTYRPDILHLENGVLTGYQEVQVVEGPTS